VKDDEKLPPLLLLLVSSRLNKLGAGVLEELIEEEEPKLDDETTLAPKPPLSFFKVVDVDGLVFGNIPPPKADEVDEENIEE
jgi:hypothetical protein